MTAPTTVSVTFPRRLTFMGPEKSASLLPGGDSFLTQEQALKEWVWKTYQDDIFASMCIMRSSFEKPATSEEDARSQSHNTATTSSSITTNEVLDGSSQRSIDGDGYAETFDEDEKEEELEARLVTLGSATSNSTSSDRYIVGKLEAEIAEKMEQLQDANNKLSKANRTVMMESQRQLEHFACMSHEIRTPLNPILALTSMLMDECEQFTPQQQENLKMIARSSHLLMQVVNDVLDYAKYESGRLGFDIVRSNLQETLETVYRPMFVRGLARGINVRAFYEPNVPEYIRTDSRRLSQIILNLLSNAIKFSKDGGLVELHVMVCPDSFHSSCGPVCSQGKVRTPGSAMREAIAKSTPPNDDSSSSSMKRVSSFGTLAPPSEVSVIGDVLRIVVKDYGKGINESDFQTIFQPFRQASNETESSMGGTGLGLPIAGKLARGLGGRLFVDSVENEWTAFTLDLPFQDSLPTNMDAVAQKMKKATVFFIFNDYFPGTVAHFERICGLYNVRVRTFADCDAMDAFCEQEHNLDHDRTYACFYYEGLYRKESHDRLSAKVQTVLLTFGPQYAVKEAVGHYGCPNSVLPAVLMDSISSYVEEAQQCISTPQGPAATVTSSSPTAASTASGSALVDNKTQRFSELRVLIAEDNSINQRVLTRILQRIGLQHIDVVDNGKKAVDKEASKAYDLLLLDMQMPVMDGLEACRIIMNRYEDGEAKTQSPRVVFVTAAVSEEVRQETFEAGASAFLSKPFTLNGIKECLERLFEVDENMAICLDVIATA